MTCFICDHDNPDAAPEGCAACDRDAEALVARLLIAIHPTRKERALSWLVGRCYALNDESGPWNWLGDRADNARVWLQRRRCDR